MNDRLLRYYVHSTKKRERCFFRYWKFERLNNEIFETRAGFWHAALHKFVCWTLAHFHSFLSFSWFGCLIKLNMHLSQIWSVGHKYHIRTHNTVPVEKQLLLRKERNCYRKHMYGLFHSAMVNLYRTPVLCTKISLNFYHTKKQATSYWRLRTSTRPNCETPLQRAACDGTTSNWRTCTVVNAT